MTRPRPTWLITGGSGFLGRALLDRLRDEDVEVVALGRRPVMGVASIRADLLDPVCLREALAEIQPGVVFHLAGKTPPGDFSSFDQANRLATTHLVAALGSLGRPVRVVVAGSAAELGPVPIDALPVGETYPCAPADDYGRSKLAATRAALSASPPVEVIVARVFNPIGPGLPVSQALGRFAAQLAAGDGPLTLTVGDLVPRRDFIDARDVADALIRLATGARPGLYHLGTGRSRSIGEGLDALTALSGRTVHVEADPSRPPGPLDSRADIRRIQAETGWTPRFAFEQSLADVWTAATAGRD